MPGTREQRDDWIKERVRELTDRTLAGRPVVVSDTTDFMSIDRDHVVVLDGLYYLVRCNERELRFGMADQPKFWVKRAARLDSGNRYILKLVVREEFKVRIGGIEVRCFRSEEKEGQVLELVRGDSRFMQGHTVRDSVGNLVRVIDFIRGENLINHLYSLPMPHEEYFHQRLPVVMVKLLDSFRAIQFLHDAGLCHGDIRTDHIAVERETGRYRWIDFDLKQDFPDYDVASIGPLLQVVVGKGLISFQKVFEERPELSDRFVAEDGASFFPHRPMNLRKLYPYVPDKLNDVLMRYSLGAEVPYERITQVVDDLEEVCALMGWSGETAPTVEQPL